MKICLIEVPDDILFDMVFGDYHKDLVLILSLVCCRWYRASISSLRFFTQQQFYRKLIRELKLVHHLKPAVMYCLSLQCLNTLNISQVMRVVSANLKIDMQEMDQYTNKIDGIIVTYLYALRKQDITEFESACVSVREMNCLD